MNLEWPVGNSPHPVCDFHWPPTNPILNQRGGPVALSAFMTTTTRLGPVAIEIGGPAGDRLLIEVLLCCSSGRRLGLGQD